MGGPNITNKTPRIASLQIQSSAFGLPIPIGWGRARVALNLIWFDGFTAEEHKKQQAGKGGSGSSSISYSYFADLILGICDTKGGPIRGVNAIYRDKSVFTGTTAVTKAGFAGLATGVSGQAPWTLLATKYPAASLGYDTTAYLYGSHYQINDSGGLQNHSVEVDFAVYAGGSFVDANPKDIVTDFLANAIPQWSASYIGDLTDYRNYCLATGILLSPCLDTQQQASAFVDEILQATNSQCWIGGDGKLQIRPLADAAVTGNGATYTPNLTPVYDLTDDDFIVDDPTDDAVRINTRNLDDLYNVVQVAFKNREHQYNDEVMPAEDAASIFEFGKRKQDPTSLPSIKDPTVARLVAQLLLQKTASFARPFSFALPWCFDRLEEMDLISITRASQGLDHVLVRIGQIDTDEDSGKLTIEADEVLVGSANSPAYARQAPAGIVTNFEASPGSISSPPTLFNPPTSLTNGQFEVWAAVAGLDPNWGGCQVWISLDGSSYQLAGVINGSARYGHTVVVGIPARDDPDTTSTLKLNLSESAGVLLSSSQAEVDAASPLCWIGGELIAYRDATLVSNGQYHLTYLRRGLYGSSPADHPVGTEFVRLDGSIFKYPYLSAQVGKTVWIKFQSFNIVGKQLQDLSAITAYSIVLADPNYLPDPITTFGLASAWVGKQFTLTCSAALRALTYTFRIYNANGHTLQRTSNATSARSFTYTNDMAQADDALSRTYQVTVVANNLAGDGPVTDRLTVTNPAPAAVTGVSDSGSGTSNTVSWNANTEKFTKGYVAYYSTLSNFDPAVTGDLFYQGKAKKAVLTGLTLGSDYFVRVAAYDGWSDEPSMLNFSAPHRIAA